MKSREKHKTTGISLLICWWWSSSCHKICNNLILQKNHKYKPSFLCARAHTIWYNTKAFRFVSRHIFSSKVIIDVFWMQEELSLLCALCVRSGAAVMHRMLWQSVPWLAAVSHTIYYSYAFRLLSCFQIKENYTQKRTVCSQMKNATAKGRKTKR